MFHRTMTRIAFFTGGATVCYAFANPDEGNVYDIFPSAKSKFAFVNQYKVNEKEKWAFEQKWKSLARFYQNQEGYLFNKLLRKNEIEPDGQFLYYGIMQWTTGDSFVRSTGKGEHKTLADAVPGTASAPLMYKIVVDDTEFDPNETFAPYNSQ